MNKPHQKVSLTAIIPIGDVKGNLQTLKSWINESKKYPLKLILIHDISDKRTAHQISEISEHFEESKLMVVHGKFGSPGLARNAGLEIVKSEWVAFWDCDDKPLLENIFNAISTSSIDDEIIIGGFQVKKATTNVENLKFSRKPTIKSISLNPGVWRMIFKSKLVEKMRFTDLKLAEDHLFISEIKLPERKIDFVSKSFYEYIYGGENQLTSKKNNLPDLQVASSLLLCKTKTEKNRQIISFNLTLIFRQQFTLVKKGDFQLKFQALQFLSYCARKANPYTFWIGIKALIFVLSKIMSSKL
jgi:glycosyltransferase involved in cell wall biosynthesis